MSFYEQFVQFEKVSGEQAYAKCPMHPDTNASFTVNTETDEWFCHGCGFGGKQPEFIEHFYGVGRDVAKMAYKQWTSRGTLPFPEETYVEECVKRLLTKPAELKVLHDFGITDDVINKMKIGLDDTRFTIPIYSQTGMLVNVRKYLPPHRRVEGSNNAKVIGVRGCNESRIYPIENLSVDKETVYLVEGEKDCLVAMSQGLNAVTGTGGSTIPLEDLPLFKDKIVYLMGDSDPAGTRITANYAKALLGIAKELFWVKLPKKDFTDFWAEYHTADVTPYTQVYVQPSSIKDLSMDTTSLTKSEYVENLNTWVTLENMCVIGVDPKIYTVPSKLKARCGNMQCSRPCKVGVARNDVECDLDPRQILQFIDSSDAAQDAYLKKVFGCKSITSEPAAFVNAQKIIFQETASFVDGLEEATFEPRYGIFLYEESRLIPTVKYNFVACRVTDPRSQQNYYVIKQAEPAQQCLEKYTEECLDYFRDIAKRHDDVISFIDEHYAKWEACLGIEKRIDLFGSLMLTYMSVTEIPWKSGVIKGWLDTMIIGDTRTGKSQMAQRFVKNLQLGSYINGENARRTGVVGGVQRYGDSWVITWGAIPMNDRGLLVIDEASGLEVEDIKELSATRSSGAVTINKIIKGEARARTRLIWLSNPRSGKNIEDFYWKGYGAFMEFIPVVEDQARYDIVVSAARGDITLLGALRENSLNVSLYRQLIAYAWSVPTEDIVISKETEQFLEEEVKNLSNTFEGGPLFVGVAAHEKMLRLSCAFAVMCGNIENRKLIVTTKHVRFAAEFLKESFLKPTLDYKGFIEESRKALKAKDDNIKFVRAQVAMYPALRVLLSANRFRGNQISEILGVDRTEASKLISELLQRGLMKISYNGTYQPDKLLVDIARQMEV